MVCAARALAHGLVDEPRFSDPTALVLLPDDERRRVEHLRTAEVPRALGARVKRAFTEGRSKTMVARTVAIDDVVREAASPELVILGAGLDGRAFRMPELARTIVFEVDHPDSQRKKRERAAGLVPTAAELRFVPVDFRTDDLDAALTVSGHDPRLPTTWIWEGVVMYLTLAEIEATLAVIARRSAAGSCLVIVYHAPAWVLRIVGGVTRRLGEPLRSSFRPEGMRVLLARHGFRATSDASIATIGAELSPSVARATRPITHLRLVTSVRD